MLTIIVLQTRSVLETLASGSFVPGGSINASSPGGYSLTFTSLAPATTFNITSSGLVYLLPGQSLSFGKQ
jgi:hypothetical protein